MAIESRLRIPEIVLGSLLTIALVAMGALLAWPLRPTFAPIDPTALFTLGLVIVGSVQVGLFIWQLRLIRESLRDTEEAARVGGIAAAAATKQARIAEDNLAKLERPYIFVFNVSTLDCKEIEDIEETGHLLKITFSVANYGKIPAIIKCAQVDLNAGPEPASPPPVNAHHNLAASPILAAGEVRHNLEEWLKWDGEVWNDEYNDFFPELGNDGLFFWVIINYRGPFSDQHETRACWRYNQRANRFIGLDDQKFSGEK
jgi:hypothetical protein